MNPRVHRPLYRTLCRLVGRVHCPRVLLIPAQENEHGLSVDCKGQLSIGATAVRAKLTRCQSRRWAIKSLRPCWAQRADRCLESGASLAQAACRNTTHAFLNPTAALSPCCTAGRKPSDQTSRLFVILRHSVEEQRGNQVVPPLLAGTSFKYIKKVKHVVRTVCLAATQYSHGGPGIPGCRSSVGSGAVPY